MSSGITRKYAPDDVTVVVGTQAVFGFQPGTFVEIEPDVDTATMDVGSDGEATLVISANRAGKMKLTLQQSSPLNDFFNTLYQALIQKNTGVAVVPFRMADKNGSSLAQAKQCVVMKPTKLTFADKAEAREWTFITGYLDTQPGGQSAL